MNYQEEKACRVCGGKLHKVFSLGEIYPSAYLDDNDPEPERAPLALAQCVDCGLVQLQHTVDLDSMYFKYFYQSGNNPSMVMALRDVIDQAQLIVPLAPGDVVCDIACNDGTTLGMYPEYVTTIGFDPARNLPRRGKIGYFINDYFDGAAYDNTLVTRAKIVTSIAVFYDLPDPKQFVRDVAHILADDGIWIMQFSDLTSMLKTNSVDNICLAPGSEIHTRCGIKAIEDIAVGEEVLTHKGRWRSVVERHENNFDGDLVRLRAYGFGSDLLCTPNHPIYVKREDWQFVPAEEIKIGDIVGKPINTCVFDVEEIPIEPRGRISWDTILTVPVNSDLLTVMGYYLAEGSYNGGNNSVTFYFGDDETETLVADCVGCLERLGFKANVYPGTTSTTQVISYGAIGRFLSTSCGKLATHKRLDDWVMLLPIEKQKILLAAYAKGDGYVYRTSYLRLITSSKELAHQIVSLYNRQGYKATLNAYKARQSEIGGRVINGKIGWDIQVNTDPKKRIKNWIENGYQCGRIRSIEEVPYNGLVYNLTVEEDNTYVTTAMTTHNCHEHLEYYSIDDVTRLIEAEDLEVFRIEHNTVNAGSLRFYMAFTGTHTVEPSVAKYTVADREYLNSPEGSIEAFSERIGHIRFVLRSWLNSVRLSDQVVYGLAASTKGNTTLQIFDIDRSLLPIIADLNPDKFGKRTVGSNIPIIAEETALLDKPDYLLVMAWHFLPFFLRSMRGYLKEGGALVVPLPEPRIYRMDTLGDIYSLSLEKEAQSGD